jgi:riboflavin kinase/FMN adenylyltransferase
MHADRMTRNALVVIGNFDGVHLGHQAVLAAVSRLSRARGLTPKMLTFEPHPAVTLGRPAPPLLTPLARKIELVTRACPGIEVVVRPFTKAFAEQSPEAFVERVLLEELGALAVMVGLNFRFGHRRAGGFDDLLRFGEQHGFEAIAEPLVSDDKGAWSSTRVRGLLSAGDVEGAAAILGRPHALSGVVVKGAQRGRTLGFPTCNIADVAETLPPFGVYAVLVDQLVDGEGCALAKGVANLGIRPTIGAQEPLLEAHLFDYEGDLYGEVLRVHLVSRLRDERRFGGLSELEAQIARDSEAARERLAEMEIPDGAWA